MFRFLLNVVLAMLSLLLLVLSLILVLRLGLGIFVLFNVAKVMQAKILLAYASLSFLAPI
ncbi:hypothetical protein D3C77_253160 [compost metagenome]